MDALRAWNHAPVFILSCPGPLRRHHAALMPVADLGLMQALLGAEAQLLAFAAAMSPDLASVTFFAPLPEIFADPKSLAAALLQCGQPAHRLADIVHLRFGSTRTARLLKGARNGAVIAEAHGPGPITSSQHPFASGLALPSDMRRVFVYTPQTTRPHAFAGSDLPATKLPDTCLTADLHLAAGAPVPADQPGLDIVSLAEFRSGPWAAGPVQVRSGQLHAAIRRASADGAPFILLPWNLDHPGSAVPELLRRLASLQEAGPPPLHPILLPFNYLGQTGLIRRLIALLRETGTNVEALLEGIFISRLRNLAALPQLRRLSTIAWVDGNDPEADWTIARMRAAGFTPILLDPSCVPGQNRVPADDSCWIDAPTRYGALAFDARVPAWRGLPALLALTAARRRHD